MLRQIWKIVQSSKEERKDGGKEEKNRAEVRYASCLKNKNMKETESRERESVWVSEWVKRTQKKEIRFSQLGWEATGNYLSGDPNE